MEGTNCQKKITNFAAQMEFSENWNDIYKTLEIKKICSRKSYVFRLASPNYNLYISFNLIFWSSKQKCKLVKRQSNLSAENNSPVA